jgi:A/G-specific adenine glycosylase
VVVHRPRLTQARGVSDLISGLKSPLETGPFVRGTATAELSRLAVDSRPKMINTPAAHALFRAAMFDGADGLNRPFPWRSRSDPYEVLIGEVLLQRTRGEHASAVYRSFLTRWPTPSYLARARVPTIEKVIRPLGLLKRASILKRLGQALVAAGGVPLDLSQLERMPGVGPYAAHSVAIFAMGRDLPLVDWVIARVLRRYFGLSASKRPNHDRDLWELAGHLAAPGNARRLWLGTLDFAAAVCKPRPLCESCPLSQSCSRAQSQPHD